MRTRVKRPWEKLKKLFQGILAASTICYFSCTCFASTHSVTLESYIIETFGGGMVMKYFISDCMGFLSADDYMEDMKSDCRNGDVQSGNYAEQMRNLKIDTLGLKAKKISFNDLYLLSKVITSEARSSWIPMYWKMMVGEVLLNRVESPEFPDTIEECVYQKGQYYSKNSKYFSNLLPSEDCVEAAVRLLNGERVINDGAVVFQANFKQGSRVYCTLRDKRLGCTYFCYSNHPELYEGRD